MSIKYLNNLVKKTYEAGRPIEGSADDTELNFLANLAKSSRIKTIGEIGFNAGLSSYTFLEINPNVIVYSFDIAEYDYVDPAKKHIDLLFPNRHVLIRGNSIKTVPQYHQDHPELKFDLIFVDGGHDYEVVEADLLNMRAFATRETILIIDDLTPWKPWGIGPTQAWTKMIAKGIITQEELWKDGKRVKSTEPSGDRSWAIGKYIIN